MDKLVVRYGCGEDYSEEKEYAEFEVVDPGNNDGFVYATGKLGEETVEVRIPIERVMQLVGQRFVRAMNEGEIGELGEVVEEENI